MEAVATNLFGSHSGGYEMCCPPVFDPYTLLALLGGIALATFFLQQVIVMTVFGRSFPDLFGAWNHLKPWKQRVKWIAFSRFLHKWSQLAAKPAGWDIWPEWGCTEWEFRGLWYRRSRCWYRFWSWFGVKNLSKWKWQFSDAGTMQIWGFDDHVKHNFQPTQNWKIELLLEREHPMFLTTL